MRKLLTGFCFVLITVIAHAQSLQPVFNGKEYTDMLQIAFQRYDSAVINPKIPVPDNYYVVYRSPETGLKNRWNMWYSRDNKTAVIAIRGTVSAPPSWLENFYAAMIPATGSLQLNDSTLFNYRLAADSKAQVHVGWTIGLGFMAPTMLQQIRLAYEKGIHEFIIAGHSQGGAIAFLARSWLFYLSEQGELPKDITWKTYCSAAPKPGNLYYGYDFDFITRGGWAYTVVNAADWVPETPFSIQRIDDFNAVNPFIHVKDILKKQKLLVRWYMGAKYNKMNRTTRKAQENFEKTLGGFVYKLVKKTLPQLKEPVYMPGNNCQRTGSPIILLWAE
jgi:Lipase (class 3)